jgi:membrane protein involved in colicin uptake
LSEVYVSFEPEVQMGGRVNATPLETQSVLFACGHIFNNLAALVVATQAELRAEYDQQIVESNASRERAQAESLERARVERERQAAEEAEQARQKAQEERERQAEWERQAPARAARDQAENSRLRALELVQRKRDAEVARGVLVEDPENAFTTPEKG